MDNRDKEARRQHELTSEQNAAAMARMDARPTPTQAENDAFKLGELDIDKKEHDGSEDETDVTAPQTRVMHPAKAAGYKTK